MSSPMPVSNSLRKFCQVFEAVAENSDKRFHKRTQIDYKTMCGDPDLYVHTETVNAIAIHIPHHRLDDFLSVVDEQRYKELSICANVPAVKLAYERYQMLLKMCGGDYDAGY